MKITTLVIAAAHVALASPNVLAGPPKPKEHFDIWLQPINGPNGPHIVTGSITEGTPGIPVSEVARVFGAELGEDPAFPFSTEEPGLQALAGPPTAGMTWSFNIVSALGRWNGGGFDLAGESMLIEFGPASVQTGPDFVAGFSFTGFPDGLLHNHFDFTLQGGSPLAGADPADGIYLLALEFLGVNGATFYDASDPLYLVFNLNMTEEQHDEAIDWVQTNLAPAPSGLLTLGIAIIGFGGQRRRRDSR